MTTIRDCQPCWRQRISIAVLAAVAACVGGGLALTPAPAVAMDGQEGLGREECSQLFWASLEECENEEEENGAGGGGGGSSSGDSGGSDDGDASDEGTDPWDDGWQTEPEDPWGDGWQTDRETSPLLSKEEQDKRTDEEFEEILRHEAERRAREEQDAAEARERARARDAGARSGPRKFRGPRKGGRTKPHR